MTGLIKTRSVGILRDEQQTSASCTAEAILHKGGSCNGAPLGDLIPQALCADTANANIDSDTCSSNQQPWPIQNT